MPTFSHLEWNSADECTIDRFEESVDMTDKGLKLSPQVLVMLGLTNAGFGHRFEAGAKIREVRFILIRSSCHVRHPPIQLCAELTH
ncbi:MAG: hypothetical protein A3H96_13590 [Acidobacteria bacterium RIFCSPLOWO2_02_FULL_67_36]|nr:MAG: hypothetical protein A3H96_13590 [Acidobacteria bacterium RIFCSPLOWO2_02_FULL_67_36]OFW25514.1 MAG: hypothetical protein A3G21_12055 [Acidobacteria bacterium RIFCSPLOWO2_12_FULL_66_21]